MTAPKNAMAGGRSWYSVNENRVARACCFGVAHEKLTAASFGRHSAHPERISRTLAPPILSEIIDSLGASGLLFDRTGQVLKLPCPSRLRQLGRIRSRSKEPIDRRPVKASLRAKQPLGGGRYALKEPLVNLERTFEHLVVLLSGGLLAHPTKVIAARMPNQECASADRR